MPNIDAWISGPTRADDLSADTASLASDIAYMIVQQGVAVTLLRGSSDLDPQTVVITPVSSLPQDVKSGASNNAGRIRLLLVGTLDHPTLEDFDVQFGDRFVYKGTSYKVTYVDKTMAGKVEASAESTQS